MVRVIGKVNPSQAQLKKAERDVFVAEDLFSQSRNAGNSRNHKMWAYAEAKRIQEKAFAILGAGYKMCHFRSIGMAS